MRKIFGMIVVLLAMCLPRLWAQQIQYVPGVQIIRDVPTLGTFQGHQNGTSGLVTTCQLDTLAYPLNKASNLRVVNLNSQNSAAALGQYYDAPQPIFIPGVRFYAYKLDANGGTNINVVVELYQARPDSLPLGMPLRSATVSIDTVFAGGQLSGLRATANFFVPITVTGPFVVVIRNSSPNAVGIVVNDYQVGDGGNEWFAQAQVNGTWRHGYQVNIGTYPLNCDALIDPVVGYQLRSDFTASPGCLAGPTTANFLNNSSPVLRHRMYNVAAFLGMGGKSVTWNFGDGTGDLQLHSEFDTTHYYASAGNYVVSLTDTIFGWSRLCSSDTAITLGATPTADFGSTGNNYLLQFQDLSQNSPQSWFWDFGDGATSTLQNPSHLFTTGGYHTICLYVTSNCGTDSTCKSIWVNCPAPTAAFGSTSNGLTASFTDLSTGGANAWVWSFGDGDSSTAQNPVHQYAQPGNYWVCLRAMSSCGVDSSWVWVAVNCAAPDAAFSDSSTSLTTYFTNLTSGGATAWAWDFGDGMFSVDENPTHTYAASGVYTVCLVASSVCGYDTLCLPVEVVFVANARPLDIGHLRVAPNPSQGRVHLTAQLPSEAAAQLVVYDMLGAELRRIDMGTMQAWDMELDLGDLAAGSYLIRLESVHGPLVQRLQVLR